MSSTHTRPFAATRWTSAKEVPYLHKMPREVRVLRYSSSSTKDNDLATAAALTNYRAPGRAR